MLVSKTGKLIFHHGENIKEESRSGLDIDGILGQLLPLIQAYRSLVFIYFYMIENLRFLLHQILDVFIIAHNNKYIIMFATKYARR